MFSWFIIVQLILILLSLLYFFVKHKQSYWQRVGLSGPKPVFMVGTISEAILNGHAETELKWFRQYGKMYGTYVGLQPTLTIVDADLIKQVLVKDFPLFINRRVLRFDHEIWQKQLFFLENDQWKRIRTITSPSITSGKLRRMCNLMNECIDQLNEHLSNLIQTNGGVMDAKKVMAGLTIDVVARTMFATKSNANASDIDSRSSDTFLYHCLNLFRLNKFKMVSAATMPWWFNRMFGLKHTFPPESFDFFCNLSRAIIQQRRTETTTGGGGKRNDLIQLLLDSYADEATLDKNDYDQLTAGMESKDDNLTSTTATPTTTASNRKQMTENEIIAQCILFFIAGFETTATTLTYALYELAVNPTIQDRLVDVCQQALADVPENSEEYYDIIMNKTPYLDAIVKETLRKYPPLTRLDRRVNVDGYKLGGIKLYKNQLVEIPSYAVHHSPEYYPEPERYDPERFMPEKKHLLVPYTFLPFGQGPRNCIGMRFALQEIKLCLAKVVCRYRILPTDRTQVPLCFARNSFLLSVKEMPLCVELR